MSKRPVQPPVEENKHKPIRGVEGGTRFCLARSCFSLHVLSTLNNKKRVAFVRLSDVLSVQNLVTAHSANIKDDNSAGRLNAARIFVQNSL